jgi:L-rhamnose isomerase
MKADVTASTLYDEAFYSGVIRNWHNEFKTIQKLKNQSFMIEDITTLKGAKDALFASLLQEKGQGFIDDILNDLRAANKFNSRSDYTKLRADLNKMLVAKNGNKADLMQEIETAIYNIARYAR